MVVAILLGLIVLSPFKSEAGWGKASIREGGIRVPMIVTWEGNIKPGTTSDHICASWDVMPTVCELAGIAFSSDRRY